MNINWLKNRNKYQKVRYEGEEFKGYELSKIKHGVQREMNNQYIWRILPFVLLVVFAIMVIVLMANGGL